MEGVHRPVRGGAVRVIAGEFRSRRLAGPPAGVRPTSDRVREAIFSSLGPVDGKSVLDLYAGTGALGIEALSRGAARVVFVDRSRQSISVIRANLEALGIMDRSDLVQQDADTFVQGTLEGSGPFDLVFLDPPYGAAGLDRVLCAISAATWLDAGAQVVVETCSRDTMGEVAGLRMRSERDYGDTRISRFDASGPEAPGAAGSVTGGSGKDSDVQ